MSKRLFTILSVLVLASMLLAACGGKEEYTCTDEFRCVTIAPDEPIHIAYWGVLSGADASLGEDSKRGVEIAIDDKGGKVLGHDVLLTTEDAGCTPEGGATAAQKLASDTSLVGLIGSSCSDETVGGIAAITAAGLTTISPSNTRPALSNPDRSPDFAGYLRTAHSDAFQGKAVAEFAYNYLKVTKAATIHDGSAYAQALQQVFADEFVKLGGTIVAQEAVAPTDTDMRPVLTKIATGKPEFIYFPIFIAAGGHITRQAKEVSGLEKAHLMSADGTFSPDFYKAAGEAAVGMYHSSPDFSAFSAGYKDFLAKHQKKYGEKPIAPFHAHGYDAAMMVFAAIEKVGVKDGDTLYVPRKAFRDALYATKGMKGLTGTISCNEFGDCADPRIAVYQSTADNVKNLVMPDTPFWKPY